MNNRLIIDLANQLKRIYQCDLYNDNVLILGKTKLPNFYKDFPPETIPDELYVQIKKIFCDNIYHLNESQFNSDDIIIDCGACCGIFSAFVASQGAMVYSIEPSPINRIYLEEIQKFYPNHITIIPKMIGNRTQKNQPFIITTCIAVNHIPLVEDKLQLHALSNEMYTIPVDMITLDDLVQQYHLKNVSYIKMDIEGSESLALYGAKSLIKTIAPPLCIATHHFLNDNELITYIISLINPCYKSFNLDHYLYLENTHE